VTRPGWSRDPAAPSFLLFAGLVVAGFVAMGLGWRVAARPLFVPFQIPALVSGALGGFALVLLGAGLLSIQSGRRAAAVERAETEALLDEVVALVEAVKRSRR
jgi:hypothetical protein